MTRPFFHPAFGSRPQQIIGRDELIESFARGLHAPIGSQERCIFFVGQRGMGKTALLLELADRADALGFVPARVTAYEGMADDIVETVQRNGSRYIKEGKRPVQGFEAGALGFSIGLTFNEQTEKNFGFRTKLTLLCDKLADAGKGILILVDEAQTSSQMRELAVTYQHLVGEDKNVAIVMAGLPGSISSILNDKVLTFLNRARKYRLAPIDSAAIRRYYASAFAELGLDISLDLIEEAVQATKGFPYLIQLIGYYIQTYSADGHVDEAILGQAVAASMRDMEDNVFKPILAPLSDNDRRFLGAMAESGEPIRTSALEEILGVGNSFIQPYRARLIEAEVIESPRKGELAFAVPHLAEYLRDRA